MAEKRTSAKADSEQQKAPTAADNSGTEAQVQEIIDRETEQGLRGIEVDPTPNENYTLAGQNAGAPTPETDEATADEARKAQREVADRATGVAER